MFFETDLEGLFCCNKAGLWYLNMVKLREQIAWDEKVGEITGNTVKVYDVAKRV